MIAVTDLTKSFGRFRALEIKQDAYDRYMAE